MNYIRFIKYTKFILNLYEYIQYEIYNNLYELILYEIYTFSKLDFYHFVPVKWINFQ